MITSSTSLHESCALKKSRGKLPTLLAATIAVSLMILSLLPGTGCGDTADTGTSTASTTATSNTAQDRAARLATQSQLRNAQMAQDAYYAENNRYASTTTELKSMDARLNAKIEVMSGSAKGYEMKITANDSSQTVYIIRHTGSRIERVDGEGNSW